MRIGKAIYWCNVTRQVHDKSTGVSIGASVLAFAVSVERANDDRLERRRAAIQARRKARSMSPPENPNWEIRVHVASVEFVKNEELAKTLASDKPTVKHDDARRVTTLREFEQGKHDDGEPIRK